MIHSLPSALTDPFRKRKAAKNPRTAMISVLGKQLSFDFLFALPPDNDKDSFKYGQRLSVYFFSKESKSYGNHYFVG